MHIFTQVCTFSGVQVHNIHGIIQICSGITRDIVLNGELYAQRLLKLIHLRIY